MAASSVELVWHSGVQIRGKILNYQNSS